MKTFAAVVATAFALSLAACACPLADKSSPAAAADLVPAERSANYPLTTCIVTGEPLGDHAVAYTYAGREVQFCCPGCANGFKAAPEKFLARLDAAAK